MKKKWNWKRSLAIIIATCSLGAVASLHASHAEPMYMNDGEYFDAEYYAETYPDVAQAVGTDTNALYQHYLTNGKAEGRSAYKVLTDSEIREKALSMKATYPEGMAWSNQDYTMFQRWSIYATHYGCGGFAFKISDAVFGDAPYTFIYSKPEYQIQFPVRAVPYADVPVADVTVNVNVQPLTFDQIKVGDIIRYSSNTTPGHIVFVLEKTATSITVCEGNLNDKVHWGRTFAPGDISLKAIVRRG